LLLVKKLLLPDAPGNRDKKINPEENGALTAVADPMRDGSRWNPGLKQGRANSKPLPPPQRCEKRFSFFRCY
jgi:hypothetical protein